MRKILLVNPAYKDDILWNIRNFKIPPLGLAMLAACTPESWDVEILDENVSSVGFNQQPDLVAITSMTYNIPRAYEIAQYFRSKGIPVVIGGVHASLLSSEAKNYCDSVVIGEAESVWSKVLSDFENNNLKPFYYSQLSKLDELPLPKRQLFTNKYSIQTVQTSRGCPFNCEFCSVKRFNGAKYRQRPIKNVISEIATIKDKTFLFADDNILGTGRKAEERAITLFKELRTLNKQWGSQISINIAENDQVLKAASESGAIGFFIGFESLSQKSLIQMEKGINLYSGINNYKKSVRKLHDYGISVTGAFVFGYAFDKKDIFDETIEFVQDAELDRAQFTIATPLPGTRFFERLYKENRMLYTNYPTDWHRYDFFHSVFRPKNMTSNELESGMLRAYSETASSYTLFKRVLKTFVNTKSLKSTLISYFYNRDYSRAVTTNYFKKNAEE